MSYIWPADAAVPSGSRAIRKSGRRTITFRIGALCLLLSGINMRDGSLVANTRAIFLWIPYPRSPATLDRKGRENASNVRASHISDNYSHSPKMLVEIEAGAIIAAEV